ncbi:MAG: hypothetical protein HXY24_11860 [Rubrivivax sp.]|nr:hypothetical protein [Rubrivivax sp.]
MRRALLSVYDKTGVVPFARGLAELGVELISTGGTAQALREAELPVRDVGEVTDFPELLDGRVKTLHPRIHGGLLARRDRPEHLATLAAHQIQPIDLVAVNLYPFEATIARPGVTREEAIEQIDIGGPAMLRSAAKNHASVTVVCNPGRYDQILSEMRAGGGATTAALRWSLACEVFERTAEYDAAVAAWLRDAAP